MAGVVTAALVQVRRTDGSSVHVYEGGVLPDDVDPEHLAALVAAEMVTVVDEAKVDEAKVDEDGEDGAPAGNASRAVWAEYATARGFDVDDSMSRDDLRDLVGE